MKILMVCLGNICRSPMAEGIMQQKIETYNLDAIVDSAGTSNYHVGESPDLRQQRTALSKGIDISRLRGRQFVVSDFDAFDLIYAMDRSNFSDILSVARSDNDRKKVKMILNENSPGENNSVPDPYYGGEDGFELVYQLLDDACEGIAHKIQSGEYR